jgi:hypothetical protein
MSGGAMSYKRKNRLEEGCLFAELMPFGGKLDAENRWMRLSRALPWDELEKMYASYFSTEGRPGKDSRLINGLLIAKHLLDVSDEEVVQWLYENPYLQYLCGFESFVVTKLVDPSTLTNMRKRLGNEYWKRFEGEVVALLEKKKLIKRREQMVDATVCSSHIAYPTDTGLLETCRTWVVKQIKTIAKATGVKEKIRTYARKARQVFLRFQKKRKHTKREVRRVRKQLLQFVRRNMKQLERIIEHAQRQGDEIGARMHERITVIRKILEQQTTLYREKTTHIAQRIVSLHRPEVRPIVRGKSGKEVEFGPKVSVSYVDGYGFLDIFSHDAYHEGNELPQNIEQHTKRFGAAPRAVIADKLYGTRENRKIALAAGIRMSVVPLGRKQRGRRETWVQRKQRERSKIEGLFGTLKTKYGLERLRYRSAEGEEQNIRLSLLAMNLNTMLSRMQPAM